MAIVGLASTVLGQLVGTSTGRYYIDYVRANKLETYRQAVTWLVYALALGCAVVTGIGALLSALLTHSWAALPLVAGSGFLVMVQSVMTLLIPILSASFRPAFYSIATSLAAVLSFGCSWALIWGLGHHADGLIWGMAIGQAAVIPFILGRFPLSSVGSILHLSQEARRAIIQFITYGAPMVLWVLCAAFMRLADRSFLQAFHGSAAVGVYGINSNLAGQAVGLAMGPLNTASWPILMKNWSEGGSKVVERSLTFFTKTYLTIGIGIVGLVAAVGKPFEDLLLGARFTYGFDILVPCLVGYVFWGAGRLGHSVLKLAQKTQVLALDALVASLLNVVLNILVVPRFGMLGAAYSLIPSFGLYCALVWWQSRPIAPWRINGAAALLNVVCAVLGWAAAGYANAHLHTILLVHLFVGAVVFGSIYGGMAVFMWINVVKSRGQQAHDEKSGSIDESHHTDGSSTVVPFAETAKK